MFIRVALLAFVVSALLTGRLYAQTQVEITVDACQKYEQADLELNQVYQVVIEAYKGDDQFEEALRKAQRAWLVFRDAHIVSLFPAEEKQTNYGSVYPMCRCSVLASLTEERTKQLRQWLSQREGDVCRGSRGIEPQ